MTTEIKKPLKHQQFIIGMMASYFADNPIWDEKIATYDPVKFLEEALPHVIMRQRLGLEKNKGVRQFLPYLIPSCTDENGTEIFYPYQRCEGIGEETLLDKVAIGYGGHVDGKDILYDKDSVVDVKMTLLSAAVRERFEEIEVDEASKAEWNSLALNLSGEFIASNDNDTDAVHLAVIIKLACPASMTLTCKEEELKTLAPMSAQQLLDSDYELENWTRKYLEYSLSKPEPTEEEVHIGFGNEVANYDPLAPAIEAKKNTMIDQPLAVVYSAFIKGEDPIELSAYAILKLYEQEHKGMPGYLHCVSNLIEAIDFPELGAQFFEQVKQVVSDYLVTRFAPDEMEAFNAGAVSMDATDSEMASSIAALEVLQGLVDLRTKLTTESISFEKYTVALGGLCSAAEKIPVDDNNTEVMLAVSAVVRAHNQTFDALGDHLTDSSLPVRIVLESNPEVFKPIWTAADAVIAPIFASLDNLAEVLEEIMPDVVKTAAAQMTDALNKAAPVQIYEDQ